MQWLPHEHLRSLSEKSPLRPLLENARREFARILSLYWIKLDVEIPNVLLHCLGLYNKSIVTN
jgi:hypothetical protein